jgi:hypothetical protein
MQTAIFDFAVAPRPSAPRCRPAALEALPQNRARLWRRGQALGHARVVRTLLAACERRTGPSATPPVRRLQPVLDAALAVFDEADDWALLALACLLRMSLRECNHQSEPCRPKAVLRGWLDPAASIRAWRGQDARLTPSRRDRAVAGWPRLIAAADMLIKAQVEHNLACMERASDRSGSIGATHRATLAAELRGTYRWRVIGIGGRSDAFRNILLELTTPAQCWWMERALVPFCSEGLGSAATPSWNTYSPHDLTDPDSISRPDVLRSRSAASPRR